MDTAKLGDGQHPVGAKFSWQNMQNRKKGWPEREKKLKFFSFHL